MFGEHLIADLADQAVILVGRGRYPVTSRAVLGDAVRANAASLVRACPPAGLATTGPGQGGHAGHLDLSRAGQRQDHRAAGRITRAVIARVRPGERRSPRQAVSVMRIPDFRERSGNAEVRHAWTGVHGLGWITWQYFCSLAGIDYFKPCVMLLRFAAETLAR